ncbi:hypothetical protein HPB47_005888 [Ixodes persulcatus]|uniref:Uncharacterized protein n=1 Tax=Ixodes persulcatus TaxID=34615 RepID=A0AC60PCV6_IXOPE|nr:hypothetical protein HPB47_005888 [Ixodes persulcatus]
MIMALCAQIFLEAFALCSFDEGAALRERKKGNEYENSSSFKVCHVLVTIITGGRKEDEEGNERVPENGERENRSGGKSQGQAATHGDDQSSEGGPAATVGDACYEQLQEKADLREEQKWQELVRKQGERGHFTSGNEQQWREESAREVAHIKAECHHLEEMIALLEAAGEARNDAEMWEDEA